MSEAESELGDLIARARRDAPGPERLAAVRARLESQLGPLDAPTPAPAAGAKGALGIAALVGLLAIGGWLATRPEPAPIAPQDPPAPAVIAPVDVAEEPEVAAQPEPEAVEPAPVAAPEPEVAPRPVRRAPIAADDDPGSTLREEIALLDRALRAREAGDEAAALAALRQHRTRFPDGRLSPERDRMLEEIAEEDRATP